MWTEQSRSLPIWLTRMQIWFQNRRQNDRRRSRPLQPHELVAHLRNSTASPIPTQVSSSPTVEVTSAPLRRANSSLSPIEISNRPASRASSIHDLLNPASSPHTRVSQDVSGQSTPASSPECLTSTIPKDQTALVECADNPQEPDCEHGSGKKRDHDEMIGAASMPTPESSGRSDTEAPVRSKEPLTRTSSMVRLAMTVDGAVKIRTTNEPTPSPEKPRTLAPTFPGKTKTPLVRSKSAMHGMEIFRDCASGAGSKHMGAGFGRSRDARTWEFFCDNASKDALSTQAEAETSGSAVSTINLIRSNSLKSRSQNLSPLVSKTNVRPTSTTKEGRPKLSRARSSLGRLQGLDGEDDVSHGKTKRHGHVRSGSGDSDKENWAPGTRLSEHPLRRTQASSRQRPILRENEAVIFPDTGTARKHQEGGRSSGKSESREKAKGEDLDCVQSLLSLSQGAWS